MSDLVAMLVESLRKLGHDAQIDEQTGDLLLWSEYYHDHLRVSVDERTLLSGIKRMARSEFGRKSDLRMSGPRALDLYATEVAFYGTRRVNPAFGPRKLSAEGSLVSTPDTLRMCPDAANGRSLGEDFRDDLLGLCRAAFDDDFSLEDLEHALDGRCLRVTRGGPQVTWTAFPPTPDEDDDEADEPDEPRAELLAHAAIVPRALRIGDTPLRSGHTLQCGYVEAVAVHPDLQGRQVGSDLMRRVAGTNLVAEPCSCGAPHGGEFEVLALSTGAHQLLRTTRLAALAGARPRPHRGRLGQDSR